MLSLLLHLRYQSTAGFIEDNLTGLRPDVVLLAATQRLYDLRSVLKTLDPKNSDPASLRSVAGANFGGHAGRKPETGRAVCG